MRIRRGLGFGLGPFSVWSILVAPNLLVFSSWSILVTPKSEPSISFFLGL